MRPEITVRLLLFAKARELAGASEASLQVPVVFRDVEELKEVIFSTFPKLQVLQHSAVVAVNEVYVEAGAEVTLRPGDEVAFIPPISGG